MEFRLKSAIIAGWILLAVLTAANAAGPKKEFFPFHVFYDGGDHGKNHGAPSGWMGDFRDLMMSTECVENPYSGKSCIKVTYMAQGSKYANWAGVIWQNPPNNWGELDGGLNLTGARKVTFWARGERGGEVIDAFKFGGIVGAYPDSDSTCISRVVLRSEWTRYEIDLTQCDLSYISGLFCFVFSRFSNPEGCTIYLDDIRLE